VTNPTANPPRRPAPFIPPPVNSVEDTKLSSLWLQELALKVLYAQGYMTGSRIAEAIALPFAGVTDQLLNALKLEKLVEVWSAAVREFDYDWAWLQIDDCIEFEVLGVGCVGEGNILRATHDYLPATRETLRSLKMPDFTHDGRMPVKLEALRRLKAEFGDTVCVAGSNAAPYSSAGLLYGLETPMLLMYEDPDLFADTRRRRCRSPLIADRMVHFEAHHGFKSTNGLRRGRRALGFCDDADLQCVPAAAATLDPK
jgi:hypothetical protein